MQTRPRALGRRPPRSGGLPAASLESACDDDDQQDEQKDDNDGRGRDRDRVGGAHPALQRAGLIGGVGEPLALQCQDPGRGIFQVEVGHAGHPLDVRARDEAAQCFAINVAGVQKVLKIWRGIKPDTAPVIAAVRKTGMTAAYALNGLCRGPKTLK